LYLSRPHLLLDNERLARDTTINILNIIRCRFKVTCRIVTLRNVTAVPGPVFKGDIQIRYAYKLLEDGPQEVKAWFDFDLGIVGFYDCRDDGEIVALGADVVCGRYLCNINV